MERKLFTSIKRSFDKTCSKIHSEINCFSFMHNACCSSLAKHQLCDAVTKLWKEFSFSSPSLILLRSRKKKFSKKKQAEKGKNFYVLRALNTKKLFAISVRKTLRGRTEEQKDKVLKYNVNQSLNKHRKHSKLFHYIFTAFLGFFRYKKNIWKLFFDVNKFTKIPSQLFMKNLNRVFVGLCSINN